MIRIVLPPHLRTLARVDGEVELEVATPVTQRSVLDALESRYPMLELVSPRRPSLRILNRKRGSLLLYSNTWSQ